MSRSNYLVVASVLALASCGGPKGPTPPPKLEKPAPEFVAEINQELVPLLREGNAAGWTQSTNITVDTQFPNARATERALEFFNRKSSEAKAYDKLDGAGKKNLHQNMSDMASMLSKLAPASLGDVGEDLGKKTYAGQECEERNIGPIVMCTMSKAPITLHSQTKLLCFNMEETATEVKLGSASDAAFAPPTGVAFSPDKNVANPDSAAAGIVNYLASQQLADSLAKAKAEIAAAQAKAGQSPGEMPKMTPAQEAEMQKACETMKNLDLGKMIADAADNAMKSLAASAKQAAVDAAKNAAKSKVEGIFKKPKIPLM